MNTPELVGASGLVIDNRENIFIPDRLWQGKIKENFSSDWLIQSINTTKVISKIRDLATGTSGSMKNISKSSILNLDLNVPIQDEQQKIGQFFLLLDRLINLQKRKVEALEKLKKCYLQQLFPTLNTQIPKLRFAGFSEQWEQKKLGDLFVKGGSGGTPTSTNKSYYNGKIPFLSISDISNSNGHIVDTEKHISDEGMRSSSAWIVPKGAISLAMYASVGKLAILSTDAATSQAFYNMVFNDEKLRNFVYHRLVKANNLGEWIRLISTGTQANLNAEKVKNFEIQIPKDKKEYNYIGILFSNLDGCINDHKQYLDNFISLKKFYLRKMFI